MQKMSLSLVWTLVLGLFVAPTAMEGGSVSANSATSFRPGTIVAVDTSNNLLHFSATSPRQVDGSVPIRNLQPGEHILGIDFRPATGQLYGLGSTSRLYVINPTTGFASQVGTGTFSPALSGTIFGFDFNPTVDRIRVVSDADQNLRLNPNTGGIASVDMNLAFAAGDPNQGDDPVVGAAAYTNNFKGATVTTLYDIDSAQDQFLTQNPPNDGVLNTVSGVSRGAIEPVGFDIASGSGTFYIASGPASPGGSPELNRVAQILTGAVELIGLVGTTASLVDISVAIDAIAGVDTVGSYVPASGTWFLRNSNTPGGADITFSYGPGGVGVTPIEGDWDGDGDDSPGVYVAATGAFFLRNASSNGPGEVPTFTFGPTGAGFVPLAGDWDGDGDDTIGLYDPATGAFFLKNTNAGGGADIVFTFGAGGLGFIPIAGDWNGDCIDTIGLYDPATGAFFLRNSNSSGPAEVTPFTFGAGGQTPVVGDFNGDAVDTIGVYASGTGTFFLRNTNSAGGADVVVSFGTPGQTPLIGDWNNQ